MRNAHLNKVAADVQSLEGARRFMRVWNTAVEIVRPLSDAVEKEADSRRQSAQRGAALLRKGARQRRRR